MMMIETPNLRKKLCLLKSNKWIKFKVIFPIQHFFPSQYNCQKNLCCFVISPSQSLAKDHVFVALMCNDWLSNLAVNALYTLPLNKINSFGCLKEVYLYLICSVLTSYPYKSATVKCFIIDGSNFITNKTLLF